MGLDICVLEASDDVFDSLPGREVLNPLKIVENDDDVAPEVTQELNRLKLLGRPVWAPSVDELDSQKTHEVLDPPLTGYEPNALNHTTLATLSEISFLWEEISQEV